MTAVGDNDLSLADVVKRQTTNGGMAKMAEVLEQSEPVIGHIPWVESSEDMSHISVARSELATVAWRDYNDGVNESKSRASRLVDVIGMMQGYSEIDLDLAHRGSSSAKEKRWTEDKAFIESMRQEFTSTLWYGNTATAPKEFMGFSPRYNVYTDANKTTAPNVFDAAGAGSDTDMTSIWLVVWNPDRVYGIYPKGSAAGMKIKDLGEQTKSGDTGQYQIYRTHFKWHVGLAVSDWRQVGRIANIDISELVTSAATGTDLIDMMVQLQEQIWDLNAGQPYFYVNRTISAWLRRQALAKTNVNLTFENFGGHRVMAFGGTPISRVDSLSIAETFLAA